MYHIINFTLNQIENFTILWSWNCIATLKTVDTIGNCQRLVFTLGVSQHMHKITNLWTFRLNRSSQLRDNNEIKKTPLSHEVVCVQMLDFETSSSNLEVSKSNSWKTTHFSKTCHFRGSRFSQCFIPSTSLHYSSPIKVLWWQLFWVIANSVHCL